MVDKKIIINADDFGLSASVNQAIIDVFLRGNLTSATLMVNMPGTEHAVALARQHPGLSVGLHFCLTEGYAVTGVSSLTDASGRFFPRQTQIARCASGKVKLADIRAEFCAQAAFFAQRQLPMAHLDSHQHIHMAPLVFMAILPEVNRLGVPIRLAYSSLLFSWLWKRPVRFFKQALLRGLTAVYKMLLRVPTNDALVSVHDLSKNSYDVNDYLQLIRHSRGRCVELFIHPYRQGADLDALYADSWADHAEFIGKCYAEYHVLANEVVAEKLEGKVTVYAKI